MLALIHSCIARQISNFIRKCVSDGPVHIKFTMNVCSNPRNTHITNVKKISP